MRFDSLRRIAAAAGVASMSTAAVAGSYPAEVTVPLGSSAPPYGYTSAYGDVSGGIVYDAHGGAHAAYAPHGGYALPARYPVERIPVQYLRYYPGVWYGLPGSSLPVVAPQVHMPTDTTQLGFYHQRVPTWMPVPGMVPPPPVPAALHTFAPLGYGAAGVVTEGAAVDGAVTNERVISVRPLNGSKAPTHSASGTTGTDPNVVPVPPGADRLPLSPPPPPASEPNTFIPPGELEQLPQIEPLFPASLNE